MPLSSFMANETLDINLLSFSTDRNSTHLYIHNLETKTKIFLHLIFLHEKFSCIFVYDIFKHAFTESSKKKMNGNRRYLTRYLLQKKEYMQSILAFKKKPTLHCFFRPKNKNAMKTKDQQADHSVNQLSDTTFLISFIRCTIKCLRT